MTEDIRKSLPTWTGDGPGRELAESFNILARRLELLGQYLPDIVGGPGVLVKTERGKAIVTAIGRGGRGGATASFPWEVTLAASGESILASVAQGTFDGVESAAFTPAEIVDGDVVYAVATYADAYSETPTTVAVAIANTDAVPSSHDTRWVVQLASVSGDPLVVKQFIFSGLPARTKRPRKSFDATREGDTLRIETGHITAIVNPSTVQSVNEAHDAEYPEIPEGFTDGTLVMSVTVTRSDEGDPATNPATFEITHSLAWGGDGSEPDTIDRVNNTDQGLFVDIDAVEIVGPFTTIQTDPKTWAAGTLSPEYSRPTTVFRIPICDLTISGDVWTIRQRQCGDIMLPLQTNWGWPSTPPAP